MIGPKLATNGVRPKVQREEVLVPRRKPQSSVTHVDPGGAMRMVDVGDKAASRRVAVARARVRLSAAARRALQSNAKGDVLAAARVAGIQAAKRTSELIPLCHPLALSHVAVDLQLTRTGVVVTTTAETVGPTGVEMEAMTAAAVAALTLYDMLKAVERGIVIEEVLLLEKKGGRSGHWRRSTAAR
ncbi:MAG: cyclic pyranopterin monophosphate synthase MoaC [Deltaproteobacteria bacterium]|nr:cyclic pyranopterin monophosphate synthase MoaC [Deltaproteobacteria bacterium]